MSAKSFTEFSRSLSLLMTSLKNGQNGQTCVWIIIIVIAIVVLIVIIVSTITLYIFLSLFLSVFGGTNFQLVGLLLPCRVNINVAALFFFCC